MLLAATGLSGCLDIRVRVISREEALANQIRGMLESLDEEVMLYESVRGVDEEGQIKKPPKITESKQRFLEAVQSQQFNADDVQEFLASGCAGEDNLGLLAYHPKGPCDACKADPAYAQFVQAIIVEENRDRRVIMMRVVEVSEEKTEADLPEIQHVFATRNRDAAAPEVWVQQDDKVDDKGGLVEKGEWARKQR